MGKPSYKSGGHGHKDSATKNSFNPPQQDGKRPSNQTREPQEQDAEKHVGQYGGEGEPPLMKR